MKYIIFLPEANDSTHPRHGKVLPNHPASPGDSLNPFVKDNTKIRPTGQLLQWNQLNLKDPGPQLPGYKQAVSLSIIGDAVEDIHGLPQLFLAQKSIHFYPANHLTGPG